MKSIHLRKSVMWGLSVALVVMFVSLTFASGAMAKSEKPIRWIAQDENPFKSPTFQNLKIICEKIEKASYGKMVIKPHPGGAIVTADTEVKSTHKGLLQMSSTEASSGLAGTFPAAPLFAKSVGGLTAMEQYFWFRVGDGLDLLNEMFANKNWNVQAIAAVACPAETFLYSNKALNKPEDLKGMKIRLLGDEAQIFKKLGVAATSTSSEELYESMQRGVVDAFQHGNLADDVPYGFYEICKHAYISPVRQPSAAFIICVNKDAWAKLPENLKILVEEVCWSQGINYYAKSTSQIGVATETWEKAGVKISPISKSIEEALMESANEFYEKECASRPFYKKVYESMKKWQKMYRAAFPQL